MYTKLVLTGDICIVTGLHIGANDAFSAIGGVDSPVVRDSYTGLPMIPGSSLKGKMRTLLTRALSNTMFVNKFENDPYDVLHLFGSNTGGGDDGKNAIKSHLIFSDSFISNEKDFETKSFTESKFENTIDRLTGVATPRQIERVIPGVRFQLRLVYDADDLERLETDFNHIALGLKLLSYDYLGGHGTRGSGRVRFENLNIDTLIPHESITDELLTSLNEVLQKEVPNDENDI